MSVRTLPLLWLSLAFLAGILLASLLALPLAAWLLASMAAASLVLAFSRRSPWLPLFALTSVCVLFAGATRYAAAQPHFAPGDLAYYNDRDGRVEIRGLVAKPPVQHDGYIELIIEAEELTLDDLARPVGGRLLARVSPATEVNYGDRLLLFGQLVTPPDEEDFSYRDYLARAGIHSLLPFASAVRLESGQGNPLWAALYSLRQRGQETLYRLYPPQSAALLAGILLGDESGLSEPLKAAFNDTGTRHIIAISGFNISIIAGIFLTISRRWLGVRRGVWVAAGGIAVYTLLVGADAAVVRAAIMGLVALLALQTGRQPLALNTLAITAALMALFNPLVLWDVGFQLSFAATLGIVVYTEPLRLWAQRRLAERLSKPWAKAVTPILNDYLFMTMAAQLTTLPILLYYFQRFSILSLPANLLILPVQPALMVLGGLSALAGLIFIPLGRLVAFFAWILATYTIRIVEFFASVPWASHPISSFPLTLVLACYAFLLVVTVRPFREWARTIRLQPAVALAVAGALCLWIWNAALAASDGRLQLTLLDVGGEALLIRTPGGRSMLINAGPSPSRLGDELSRELALDERLDWLIVAGAQTEQVGALSGGLARVAPSALAWEGYGSRVDAIVEQAEGIGLAAREMTAGDSFDLGDGARLDVLAVGGHGAVLSLTWREFSALLPLGLDFELMDELAMGRALPPVSLLLLADAGYPPLNPAEWIRNLAPQVIWVAASEEALSQETLAAVGGYALVRADEHGWLRVTTDGAQMWLQSDH